MTTYTSWITDTDLVDLLEEGDVTPQTLELLRGDVHDRGLSDSRCHSIE